MRAVPSDYELVSPGTLAGALALVAEGWIPIAGGTELMVQFAAGRLQPRRLVNIFGLPELAGITIGQDNVILGAGVTYAQVRQHQALATALPLLALAASWTGSVANQNRGTLGGNIVNGSPAADTPPALLAYGASLHLVSAQGTRWLDYADFHAGYKLNALHPGEILAAIRIPIPPAGTVQYLRKVGPRKAQAISKIALGATACLENGLITTVRLGLASVAASPFRCRATEASLLGKPLSPELIIEARAALAEEIGPLDDIRSTGRYRAAVAGNLLQEFLERLPG